MYMVLTNLEQCVGNIVYIYYKKKNFTESKYIKNATKPKCFQCVLYLDFFNVIMTQPICRFSNMILYLICIYITVLQKHALDAPERAVWRDGDYAFGLLKTSNTLTGSNEEDAVLCPRLHLSGNTGQYWKSLRKEYGNFIHHLLAL